MAQRDQYFLGQSLAEQERLRRQAEELVEDANLLFDRIAIAPGSQIVELGCGPRGCLEILSRRVGCQGSVDDVLNTAVAEIIVNEPSIRALVGQDEAAGMEQHVMPQVSG